MADPLLKVAGVHAGYGQAEVLKEISLHVRAGETVGLIGPNGAGKTTLLKCIFGAVPVVEGNIYVDTKPVGSSPEQMIGAGVALVPEGRRVFSSLTVMENLVIGGFSRKKTVALEEDREQLLERFPILRERRNQLAGKLSGGEQQMLAIARALMSRPRLLLMDEPSMGLAPMIIREVAEHINDIRAHMGTTVLLAEQDVDMVAAVASRLYVMSVGRIVAAGATKDFLDQDQLAASYWGGASATTPTEQRRQSTLPAS